MESTQHPHPIRPRTIRLLLLGESSIGKASILTRLIWANPSIPQEYDPTLEITTYSKVLSINGQPIELQCQELDFGETHPTHGIAGIADGFDACMFVYSVTRRSSFDTVRRLYGLMYGKSADKKECLFVAANKTDLPRELWEVDVEEGREFSREIGAEFRVFSALLGVGCEEEDAVEIARRVVLHLERAGGTKELC